MVAFLELAQFRSNAQEDKRIEVSFNESGRIVGIIFQCHYPPYGMRLARYWGSRVGRCSPLLGEAIRWYNNSLDELSLPLHK